MGGRDNRLSLGLGGKVRERFPEIASAGRGRDWAYTGWFAELLGFAVRGTLPVAYAEFHDPVPWYLPTTEGTQSGLPMPPLPTDGWTDERVDLTLPEYTDRASSAGLALDQVE